MNLFKFAQMVPIVSKFEWSSFNYLNLNEAVGIYPNVSDCIQITMKRLFISQIWMQLFEVAQNWIKLFELWRYAKLNEVPLGPNLNRAIAICWKLIWSVEIYPKFSSLWKYFQFHPHLNKVVLVCSNLSEVFEIYSNASDFIQIWSKLL